jgi:hypothetical protein
LPVHAKGLAKFGEVGEARRRQTDDTSPDFTEYADPPSGRVLRFYGFGVAPREKRDAHAADSARSASLPDYRRPINPTGRNACAEGQRPA